MSTALSILLAAAIGVAYVAAVFGTYVLAGRAEGSRFMGIMLGGALARMVAVLVLVGGFLLLGVVEPLPFAVTLSLILVAGLALDAMLMFKRMSRASAEEPAASAPLTTPQTPPA